MIDWNQKRRVADVELAKKRKKAEQLLRTETPELLAEFMDAILSNDNAALAKLRSYRTSVKSWLADPAGPDIGKKPKRG